MGGLVGEIIRIQHNITVLNCINIYDIEGNQGNHCVVGITVLLL